MTHPPATPQRRAVDRGRFQAARAWWERWGDPVMSGWLFVVTIVLVWVAVAYYHSQHRQERDAAVAAYQSTLSCRRTRAFGPPIADAYGRFRILNAKQLISYRATIPKRCPPLPARAPAGAN